MTDALSKAFEAADAMRSHKAASLESVLSSAGGVPFSAPDIGRHSEQYKHNKGWAYVAVRAISQRIAGQDVFVGKAKAPNRLKHHGDRVEPLESHPLLTALHDPNPLQVQWQLINSTVASLELTGRAFWWYSDGELWPLPSTWVEPLDNLRTGWKIRLFGGIDEIDVSGEAIAAFTLPDPSDPFKTVSPLQSQSMAVVTDESLQTAQHRSFKNGTVPQLLIKAGRLPGMQPGQPGEQRVLEPAQRKQLIESILAIHRGAVNYHEPLILDGMIEGVEKLSNTANKMDFLESGKQTKSRILQAFGVNPVIVGELENSNRASAVVAEQHFCNTTVNPLIQMMSQTLSRWASRLFNEPLAVWIDPCVANDHELQLKRWQAAAQLGYVTQNEFRQQVMNLQSVVGGDEFRDVMGRPVKEATTINRINGHQRCTG